MVELLNGEFGRGDLDGINPDSLLGGSDDAPLADSLLSALQVPGGAK